MPPLSLEAIANKLVEPGKGILAADESEPTIAKRFASVNIANTSATTTSGGVVIRVNNTVCHIDDQKSELCNASM